MEDSTPGPASLGHAGVSGLALAMSRADAAGLAIGLTAPDPTLVSHFRDHYAQTKVDELKRGTGSDTLAGSSSAGDGSLFPVLSPDWILACVPAGRMMRLAAQGAAGEGIMKVRTSVIAAGAAVVLGTTGGVRGLGRG